MKKFAIVIVGLTLLLAALACNFPSRPQPTQVPDVPEVTMAPDVPEPFGGFVPEKRIYGQLAIEFAVPASYYLGDPGSDLANLVENVDLSGIPVQVDLEGILASAQEDLLLWGYDAGSEAQIPTSFVVIKNEEFAGIPLGIISTFAGSLLGGNVEIIEEQRLDIGDRDTLRWITVTSQAGYELTQAVYLFKETGRLYIVGFNADRQEVLGQLATYDAIVASLTIEELE